jgi:hypothetical protein
MKTRLTGLQRHSTIHYCGFGIKGKTLKRRAAVSVKVVRPRNNEVVRKFMKLLAIGGNHLFKVRRYAIEARKRAQ